MSEIVILHLGISQLDFEQFQVQNEEDFYFTKMGVKHPWSLLPFETDMPDVSDKVKQWAEKNNITFKLYWVTDRKCGVISFENLSAAALFKLRWL